MLRHVGLGVAMGNASDTVKAMADAVCQSVDDDGIAKFLESLGL
jgi:hydroxymethylpyrimidine pyrophosphatase-like HAD family hydrolase